MYGTCQELYAKRVDGKYTESFEPATLKYTRICTKLFFFSQSRLLLEWSVFR